MKTKHFHKLLLATAFPLLAACTGSTTESAENSTEGPYTPTWESVSQFPKAPEYVLDAKFGIYTHWGPVTVATDYPESGGWLQWYGMHMYMEGHNAYDNHLKRYGDPNEFGYKDLTKLFKGENFDAEEWARIFARSGARFAGPVAIHHDNYAMWDSEVTPWNSMDQSPGRDFTGELAKAIKAEGMMYLTAFHHAFTWDYFIPSFDFDAADGTNKALYTEPHGHLDPPSREFLDNWLAMINEVVGKYEPDMIWYDFGLGKLIPDEYQLRMFADYYNWATAKNKDAVVFHKHEKIQRYTGVLDFERGRTNKQTVYPWLTDTSLGPWFHDPDRSYYTADQLIDILLDIISKNGCMLLNVGPTAEGSITQEAQDILAAMGDWLEVNGEGVFETRPWKVFGEGPSRMEKSGGFSEDQDFEYTAQDIRFTQSKDEKTIYAFLLGQPEGSDLVIKSFHGENKVTAENIGEIRVLGSDTLLSYEASEDGVKLALPAEGLNEIAIGLKISMK